MYSEKKRSRGNDLYTRGDFAGAIDVYKRALKYLEGKTEKVLHFSLQFLINNHFISVFQIADKIRLQLIL